MELDAERIVSDHLRAEVGARVVGKPPADTATAWVRVVQLDALDEVSSRAEWLLNYLLQFDCYAGRDGGQREAKELGRRVRSSLVGMPGIENGEAIVTAVRIAGSARVPDTTLEPARERVVLTAVVHMHPALAATAA